MSSATRPAKLLKPAMRGRLTQEARTCAGLELGCAGAMPAEHRRARRPKLPQLIPLRAITGIIARGWAQAERDGFLLCREILVQKNPRLQDSLGQEKCPGSQQFSRWFAIKLSEFARQGDCDATSSRGDPAGHANEQLAWLRSRCSPPTGYPGGNPLTSLRHVSLGSTADPSRFLAGVLNRGGSTAPVGPFRLHCRLDGVCQSRPPIGRCRAQGPLFVGRKPPDKPREVDGTGRHSLLRSSNLPCTPRCRTGRGGEDGGDPAEDLVSGPRRQVRKTAVVCSTNFLLAA